MTDDRTDMEQGGEKRDAKLEAIGARALAEIMLMDVRLVHEMEEIRTKVTGEGAASSDLEMKMAPPDRRGADWRRCPGQGHIPQDRRVRGGNGPARDQAPRNGGGQAGSRALGEAA